MLDLHGNLVLFLTNCVCNYNVLLFKLRYIDNIGHLSHLRVLNLAGNNITVVEDLSGLSSLAELNLRRNRITHVSVISVDFIVLKNNYVQLSF